MKLLYSNDEYAIISLLDKRSFDPEEILISSRSQWHNDIAYLLNRETWWVNNRRNILATSLSSLNQGLNFPYGSSLLALLEKRKEVIDKLQISQNEHNSEISKPQGLKLYLSRSKILSYLSCREEERALNYFYEETIKLLPSLIPELIQSETPYLILRDRLISTYSRWCVYQANTALTFPDQYHLIHSIPYDPHSKWIKNTQLLEIVDYIYQKMSKDPRECYLSNTYQGESTTLPFNVKLRYYDGNTGQRLYTDWNSGTGGNFIPNP